jgi:hypothetical protein
MEIVRIQSSRAKRKENKHKCKWNCQARTLVP